MTTKQLISTDITFLRTNLGDVVKKLTAGIGFEIKKRGVVIGILNPVEPQQKHHRVKPGFMKGTCEILGDVISPAIDESEWEMLKDNDNE